MAFDPVAFNPAGFSTDFAELSPVFHVEQVQLQFQVAADFAAVQVANNVIILALVSGRILRIDLANPQDVDDIDLPKKSTEVGTIQKVFLDPTASHLIISTTHGENFYLHSRSTKPRHLSRLKSVHIECVAWSPALPSTSTREILVGAQDGSVYETYIEGVEESFMRREEKYSKLVYKTPEGQSVTGLWVDMLPGKPDLRRVILTTPSAIMHWVGRIQRYGHDIASIFAKFFDSEGPNIQDFRDNSSPYSMLSISPDSTDEEDPARVFAWLTGPGVYHGKLLLQPANSELGAHVFSTSKLFSKAAIPTMKSPITSVALTEYHVIILCGTDIYAINRLDDSVVFQEAIVDPDTRVLGLCSDVKKSTFWVFTTTEIFEVKDQVAVAHGDYHVANGKYVEAAEVYGKSSKNFEEVALTFLENGEPDALRTYLLAKLVTLKPSSLMQRVMVASWLVEVFMSRLNSLEDDLSTITSHAHASETSSDQIKARLSKVKEDYQQFVSKYKGDLDRKTTYEIISSHGRQYELLFYANTINDYSYVLAYWVQREKWLEALNVLKRQTDPEMFYKYSSVLMANVPMETVDILMRQSNLKPRNLIPALLNYNKFTRVPLNQNQAVRYLLYVIHQLGSEDAAVHNTLISIYASHPSQDEQQLLQYLEAHTGNSQYDSDFALRLCIQHGHVQSCVHIYSSMGQFSDAVELALKHGNVELASIVADRPEDDPALRKKLWLSVAKKVISQAESIKNAIEFLRRCELLKIEDLIPFFPDFVVIDDFKEEICTALEDYSHNIDQLKKEMDESAVTAEHIRKDIASLDRRYAIVEPGERCYICQYPLLSRQFFHSGVGKSRRIEDLQNHIQQGLVAGKKREKAVEDLDNLIASECILCSEFAIKRIDEPFVLPSDDVAEWSV
ncbi:Pep3/Vps18/deep orange family-domain-containing protein [Trichophaea hybrida]|nr:Pep3/Vps18/deep orange family-domain-containing protein [Trichophaea hybrida]